MNIIKTIAASVSLSLILLSCNNKQEPAKTPQEKTPDIQSMEQVAPAEAKITSIEYKFKEGSVHHYKMEQVDEFTQDDSIKATNALTLYYTKTIKRVKDEMISFSLRYDSISQRQRGTAMPGVPSTDISYNSNDSASKGKKEFLIMNALIGETVDVTMDSKGKVEEFSGLSPIVNSIIKKSGETVGEREKTMLAEQLKIGFYGQVVMQEHQALPDSTLDSTMSWSRNAMQQIPPYLVANNKLSYKISRVAMLNGTKVLNIVASLKGDISVIDKKLPIKIKSSSVTGSGNTIIEASTGVTRSKETTLAQSITMEVANPQTKQQQSLKQYKTMKLKVTLLD